MSTPSPAPKRFILKHDELAKYSAERGWTSLRKQARDLGLDHTCVMRSTKSLPINGTTFLAQLIADAMATGLSLGDAFERFVEIADDQSTAIADAA